MEIGELRNELTKELQDSLDAVLLKYQGGRDYWILVFADVNALNEIKTTLMRLTQCPPKMIGTLCYHVDNRAGKVERIWVLPQDIPRHPGLISIDEGLEEIARSGQNVPIIY